MKEKQKDKAPPVVTKNVKNPAPEKETIWQMILPHIIAVAVFIVITFLYFSPMLVGNKMIQESDIIHNRGMSKELADYRAKTGKEALWTNTMFGGMPGYQISVYYNGNFVRYIDKIISLGFPHPSELLFIALISFYILMIVLGVNSWLAIAGAIAYALCSYDLILLEVGHTSKMHAIGLLPLAVAGVWLLRQGKYWWGAAITAVGLSLQVYANHLQITYYLFLLLLVYAIVELIFSIRDRKYRNLLITGTIVAVCGIFSVVSNLSMLWSTYDYVPSTIRGPSELTSNKQSTGGLDKDYAMAWSYGKMETFTLLIPNINGGSSNATVSENSNFGKVLKQYGVSPAQLKSYLENVPMYWGDQPSTSGPVYVGAIICFLFIFGMLMIRDRWKWWILAATILSFFLAWGKNWDWFSSLFFYYFPGYNKFRTVSMILVIAQFTFPFLAFVMLNRILNGTYEKKELISKLKLSVYITGGLCLFFALFGTVIFNFQGKSDGQIQKEIISAIIDDRKAALRIDAFRSLVFILLSAALIWAFVNNRLGKNVFIGGIVLLVFADLFPVGKRYLNDNDFIPKNEYDKYFQATQADLLILKDTSPDYRVFNLASDPFNDSRTSYFHKSVGGYHAAKLRRYQEIIEHQLTKSDSTKKSPFPFNKQVVDMLNTKYIIYKAGEQEQVLPNTGMYENAWFVSDLKMVNNADEEMNALNDFEPGKTVIVDKRFSNQLSGFTPSPDSGAVITLEKYEPNDLLYKSKSSKENVAVFSEIYYQPGWDAFIDGKKADHFRCNYILRGMRVPAGEHTIEFKFEPTSYYTGEKVAMGSSGLILLLLIGVIGREIMNRRKQRDGEPVT